MTKFNELVKFVARRKTFKWGDVNRFFGHPVGSLNSYTTYLNTLTRAGLVKQTARGQYEVTDADLLKATSLREISLKNRLVTADQDLVYKDNRINLLEKSVTKLCEEKTQMQYVIDEKSRGSIALRDRILLLEGRLEQERKLVVSQLDRLNAYNVRITKFEASFFGRLAKLFKRSV